MARWLLIITLAATPAAAHHSLAGYDSARSVTLDGLVTEFQYAQPHPILVISVGAPGGAQTWKLEMDNLYELDEIGMTRDTFRPKDRVTVMGSPGRHQANTLYLRSLDRPRDGLHYEQVGFTPAMSFRGK